MVFLVIIRARRFWNIYTPVAATVPKQMLQYNVWFWVETFRSVIAMVIFTAFWRAIYGQTASIAGLELTQTLNYVILARALGTANGSSVYWTIAEGIVKGQLELELLRPLDFQLMNYVREFAAWFTKTLWNAPILLIGILGFGARLPSDPLAYLAFLVTFILGGTMLYLFEYTLGCLGFYVTELWGLSVLRDGVALFFSGALIPLDMMPAVLKTIAGTLPFAQALYVPISFLSGIKTHGELPQAVLSQLVGIVVMLVISRFVFFRAVRVLTVQGG